MKYLIYFIEMGKFRCGLIFPYINLIERLQRSGYFVRGDTQITKKNIITKREELVRSVLKVQFLPVGYKEGQKFRLKKNPW